MLKKKFLLLNILGLFCTINNQVNAQWTNVGTGQLTSANGTYGNIVKDNSGNLFVSYYSGGNGSTAKVQKYNGIQWSYAGDSTGVTTSYAIYNRLASNNNGDIFLSYQDGANSNGISVKQYSSVTNSWNTIGTNLSNGVVNYQDIKTVPNTGYPVVSYKNTSGINVKIYNGTTWSDLGTNPAISTTNYNQSLYVSNADTVYVVGQNANNSYTVYKAAAAQGANATWQVVGTSGFTSGGSSNQFTVSLTGDSLGNLYMAYRDLSTNGSKVLVSKYSNGNWSNLGTAFGSGAADHISITLDNNNNPLVAFKDAGANSRTTIYKYISGTWTSLGSASTNYGQFNSIITQNDTPILAYADGTALNGGNITVKKFTGTIVVNNCYVPQSLTADSITQNAATLTWTNSTGGSTAQTYKYELRTSGLPGTGAAGLVDSSTQTALTKSYSNLTNGQTYYFSVRANCDTQSSAWITDTFSTILYQTVTLTGFNYDVIANGAYSGGNTALTSTTNAVDDPGSNNTGGYAYFAQDYNGGNADLFPIALPINRILSVGIKSFKFANYDSANVLKLTNQNEIDTLNFQTAASAKVLHLLAVSGSGSSTGDVKLIFTDGSTKLYSSQTFDDWYGSNAYYTTRRVYRTDGIPVAAASNGPNLYEYSFTLDNTDTGKTIQGVEIKKTSTAGYLNIFAISIEPSIATIIDTLLTVQTENNVSPEIATANGTLQMEYSITPSYAASLPVTWSIVSVTGTATITSGGLITALTDGTIFAKATLGANSNIVDSMLVTISNQQVSVTGIQVQTENNVAATITTNGGTLNLIATIYPTNANNQNVNWSIVPVTGTATISTSGVVTAQTNGLVYAKAVAQENANITDSIIVTITNNNGNNTGVDDIVTKNNIRIYPNPANNEVNIMSQKTAIYTYTVYNAVGQMMTTNTFSGQSTVIPLTGYAAGYYLIKIETNGSKGTLKFLKE